MILIDIYDMTGWWTILVAIQVILLTVYFIWSKNRNQKSYDRSPKLVLDWDPLPLVEHDVIPEQPHIMGRIDEDYLNVGATSFLGFDKEESITIDAIKTLNKYGVGSCGPRGFYGTIDVHLELEEKLAKFLEVEETCVYSYGFSTISCAIQSYAKRNDIIFADESVYFPIQKGIQGSRSTVRYFKHNDMEHLESLLTDALKAKQLNPKRRAFLIVEGIYYNTGEMCALTKVVELARRFKLRIMLDESLSIGVLGKHGRGITEHLNIPRDEIDLIMGTLEHSFASIGGFCAGTHFIVDHQRLSGLGYCFSASLPPMLSQATITGLSIIESKPHYLQELEINCKKIHKALSKLENYRISGHEISPVKHIYLKRADLTDRLKHSYLRDIGNYCLLKGVAFAVSAYIRDVENNCPEPSIRFACNRKLTDNDINLCCRLLQDAYLQVGPKPDLRHL